MKICLIAPETVIKVGPPTLPAAILYIAALTPDDIELEFIDLRFDSVDYSKHYDLVAISSMTVQAIQVYNVADAFRRNKVRVAIGGYHATTIPLDAKKHADVVVIGEAEYIWKKLIEDLKNNKLYDYYIGGRPASFVEEFALAGRVCIDDRLPDLKNLPHIRRDIVGKRYPFDAIFTTRGCPYNCKFCCVTKFFGPTQRHRPIPDVIKELHEVKNLFFLLDDNCFFPKEYYLELYRQIYKEFGMSKHWYGQASLSMTNDPDFDEYLETAKNAGLFALLMGIESLNPMNLKDQRASKKVGYLQSEEIIDFSKMVKSIEKIHSHGVMVWGTVITGMPFDDDDTFQTMLKFFDEVNIIPLPSVITPYPGSEIWKLYEPRMLPGIQWKDFDSYQFVFKHNAYENQIIEDMIYKYLKMLFSYKRIFKRIISHFKHFPAILSFITVSMNFTMRKMVHVKHNEIKKKRTFTK